MSSNEIVPAGTDRLYNLGDQELLSLMKRLAAAERTLSVCALAHLGEVQRRKLYEEAGYGSMFAYCVGELRYSEANAYRRLQAAEAARKFPEVLSMLRDGVMTICALSVIAKHLTRDNSARVLKRIEGKSVRDVERLVAELAPRPDTRDSIRAVPAAVGAPRLEAPADVLEAPILSAEAPAPPAPQRIAFLSPKRVHFGFTGSGELLRVIDRLKELLWHKFPAGALEDVLLEVGKSYLAAKDPQLRLAAKPRPARKTETRFIPRWVKSKVYRRDGGQCVYTTAEGRRCEERRGLEFDHIRPWARGGSSDDPANIRLLCRAHNQSAARAAGLG